MKNKVLFISNVWPEVKTTAAGRRTYRLISFFQDEGYDVYFSSTSGTNKHSEELVEKKVKISPIALNNDSFDQFTKELAPTIVVFDRFMMEEQFGWRVKDNCPEALTILDTIDIHFLRTQRQEEVKDTRKKKNEEVKLRELGAIFRCDLSLIISKAEMTMLTDLGIPKNILHCLPFGVEAPDATLWKSFEERKDFVTIGSFLHAPNVDSLMCLKKEVWPVLRKLVPGAKLMIYGAYCQEKHLQLTNEREGFFVKGFANDALEVIGNAKVLLAPLRFGAGLKGKLLEAMLTGTPSVTTSIGAEGMVDSKQNWPGAISDDLVEFAHLAADLYKDEGCWSVGVGKSLLNIDKEFNKVVQGVELSDRIKDFLISKETRRSQNLMGQILNYHSNRSTKFMSMWITEKNKKTS